MFPDRAGSCYLGLQSMHLHLHLLNLLLLLPELSLSFLPGAELLIELQAGTEDWPVRMEAGPVTM